jgi:photosystem II stability/assembly factor-like uncharacterized protein
MRRSPSLCTPLLALPLVLLASCGTSPADTEDTESVTDPTVTSSESDADADASVEGGSPATTLNTSADATTDDSDDDTPGSEDDDGSSSSDDGPPLDPDPCVAAGTCPPGVWVQVTPPDLGDVEFGPGPVVVDPAHPSDLYMGGGGDGIWKSEDYGNTWSRINSEIGYVPMGLIIAVAGTEPATVWVAGYHVVHKSTDGGVTYTDLPFDFDPELYSIVIDPYDNDHLISGLHEADGIVESFDGGETWELVGGTGFPGGGVSWYAYFIDDGNPATTRESWIAIAQNGASVVTTADGGANWTVPAGIEGLNHAHGNAQIFQSGDMIFVPGVGGPGDGVYRSDDLGASFTRVSDGVASIAWGTENNVYAMWGWACAGCDLGAGFKVSPLPGDAFSMPEVPADLIIGANNIAVTSDGTQNIFVGTMWSSGVWRYVEPS